MLKIGEFSRLSQVTVKTLHHYDEIGLLKPSQIDPFTGYRYYTVEQLPQVHRIMALKALGLSLEQIATMVADEISTDHIRDILQRQQTQIQQRIQEEQRRLSQVAFRLRMIELEEHLPNLDVVVKPIPPFTALTLRTSIGHENHAPDLHTFQRETEHAMAQGKFKLVGPIGEIYYGEEFRLDWQDVEFVLPVDESQTEDVPLETAGVLRLKTVPALSMAATYVHYSTDTNGYDTDHLSEVMPILRRWIVDNGYRLCGSHRTVRHHGPLQHAEYLDWITEFQHEIALAE